MQGLPPRLTLRKRYNNENNNESESENENQSENAIKARHKIHKKTLENIREGIYGETYLGENGLYHIKETQNNNNLKKRHLKNIKNLNISRWAIIPTNDGKGGKFFEVPITPNPSPPANTPPPLKRYHRTIKSSPSTNKRNRNNLNNSTAKKQKVGGKRRTQRKTSRRYN
jgi:hypothetical protein